MKILHVHKPSSPGKGNPFVAALVDGLRKRGHDVAMSLEAFWSGGEDWDVVHFHWPKVLFGARWESVTDEDVAEFERRLADLRSRGAKIVYTRHNAVQHYGDGATGLNRIYGLLERESDAVLHMGRFSRDELVARFGAGDAARHFIVPHPVYPDFPRDFDRTSARRRLGLPLEPRIVLSFGAFRSHEEREMVFHACRDCCMDGILLVAPRFFKGPIWRGGIRSSWCEWRYRRSFAAPWARYGAAHVLEDYIPAYFTAADVVFIQRLKILNSGNLPMGFYYGKPVLGPDVGDVGEILKESGNPTFSPGEGASVSAALRRALDLADGPLGEANRAKADADWNLDKSIVSVESVYDAVRLSGDCRGGSGK